MIADKSNRTHHVNPDKELIDRMIAWRQANRPKDQSPIKTSLDPQALHKVLGLPPPCRAEATGFGNVPWLSRQRQDTNRLN